jgi:hypothetical protein
MKKTLLIIATILLLFNVSYGQNTAKIQSIFIYNFIKLIEWPSAYKSGSFNITVLGNDPIYNELVQLAKAKKAGSQTIKVTKVNGVGEIGNPHILYVPRSKAGDISSAKGSIGSKSTLLISDSQSGIADGADINFIIVGNKPKFEISTKGTGAKKLKISSSLLNLGIQK